MLRHGLKRQDMLGRYTTAKVIAVNLNQAQKVVKFPLFRTQEIGSADATSLLRIFGADLVSFRPGEVGHVEAAHPFVPSDRVAQDRCIERPDRWFECRVIDRRSDVILWFGHRSALHLENDFGGSAAESVGMNRVDGDPVSRTS